MIRKDVTVRAADGGMASSVPPRIGVSAGRSSLVATAVGLSLAGGAIAGLFGGWRAARMRPADAMRQVV